MFLLRAHWAASILPSMPRVPNPPGTRIPLQQTQEVRIYMDTVELLNFPQSILWAQHYIMITNEQLFGVVIQVCASNNNHRQTFNKWFQCQRSWEIRDGGAMNANLHTADCGQHKDEWPSPLHARLWACPKSSPDTKFCADSMKDLLVRL